MRTTYSSKYIHYHHVRDDIGEVYNYEIELLFPRQIMSNGGEQCNTL